MINLRCTLDLNGGESIFDIPIVTDGIPEEFLKYVHTLREYIPPCDAVLIVINDDVVYRFPSNDTMWSVYNIDEFNKYCYDYSHMDEYNELFEDYMVLDVIKRYFNGNKIKVYLEN